MDHFEFRQILHPFLLSCHGDLHLKICNISLANDSILYPCSHPLATLFQISFRALILVSLEMRGSFMKLSQ